MSALAEIVRQAIIDVTPIRVTDDGVKVATTYLYPSGSSVRVSIVGGLDSFVVSDDGGAVNEVDAGGINLPHPDAVARSIVPEFCSMKKGVIRSQLVNREDLPFAILMVANTSKEVADHLYKSLKITKRYNFKEVVAKFLVETFDDRVKHNQTIVGASNKPYHFENVIHLPDGRRLIVDPVLNDPNSRNSRMVANLDVKQAHYADIEQRMVFDDDEPWSSVDINVMNMAAKMVAFSHSATVFQRLVG